MKKLISAALLLFPLTLTAESRLPFLKDLAGDRDLPPAFGIGFDFFTLDQDYDIDSLSFSLPGVSLSDPSAISVRNEVQHFDIKLDAWLFPFLNVFAILGRVDAETTVDLSNVPVTGLPFPLGALEVEYNGLVYGAGLTLAAGGDHWFSTLTATFTDTNLDGDFDSSVESLTLQPRIGRIQGPWQYWVGGFYLDTDESHSGNINFPGLGQIPFAVTLAEQDQWNYGVGARYEFSPKAALSLEVGFGGRDHTLFNYTYRF